MSIALYRSIFAAELTSAKNWQNDETAKASLEGLRPLLPAEIDLAQNPDLISTAFNGAVGNMANGNHDCVGLEESIILAKTAYHKALNLEHKSQKIVGHLITSGFSTFEGSEILSEEQVRDLGDAPFNISFGGVIYSKIHPDLGKLVMASTDPNSKFYQTVSTSFEVAFSNFHIMMGSKFVKDAEIISDANQIKEMKKYLKRYGGSGFYKNDAKMPVYRKIVGQNILTIGHALTSRPAAQVKGLIAEDADSAEASNKTKATISLFCGDKEKSVTKNNSTNDMDIETLLQEMHASLEKLVSANETEQANANLAKELAPKLKELNAEWVANRNKAMQDKEAAEAKMTELYAQVEKMSKQLSDAEQKLWTMEENSRATKTLMRYNERMAAMDEEFEMDDDDRALVASKLKTLEVKDEEQDSVFASFKDEMNKLWKHKNKAAIAKAKEEFDAKLQSELDKRIAEIAKASQVEKGEEGKTVDDALESAKAAAEKSVTNNNEAASSQAETLIEKIKKSFTKDSIKVQF